MGATSLPGTHLPLANRLRPAQGKEGSKLNFGVSSIGSGVRFFGTSTFMAAGGIASIGGSPVPKSREAAEIQKDPTIIPSGSPCQGQVGLATLGVSYLQ